MKFCAVICEYNPFHNGHLYQFSEIKRAGAEKILCLMSGNFTQRGEAAVLGKYVRARHAVLSGADVVLELPAAFSVGAAETFARGGVKLLSSLPCVDKLAFGCESGNAEDFLRAAKATLSEDKTFKETLKENMKDGSSYVKARTAAVLALNTDVDEATLTTPNNILGVEYCRAILSSGAKITPLPIGRVGSGYADTGLAKNFSSATALRAALRDPSRKTKRLIKKNVPEYVLEDLENAPDLPFEKTALFSLLSSSAEEIALCPDCGEGLENRLKAMARANPSYGEALQKVVSKRYTLSRVKRILAQNLLKIRRKEVKEFLESPLYCKVLAVKKESAEEIFSTLKEGAYPLLTRKSDALALKKTAIDCFACDVRANDLYGVLSGEKTNEYETLFL